MPGMIAAVSPMHLLTYACWCVVGLHVSVTSAGTGVGRLLLPAPPTVRSHIRCGGHVEARPMRMEGRDPGRAKHVNMVFSGTRIYIEIHSSALCSTFHKLVWCVVCKYVRYKLIIIRYVCLCVCRLLTPCAYHTACGRVGVFTLNSDLIVILYRSHPNYE